MVPAPFPPGFSLTPLCKNKKLHSRFCQKTKLGKKKKNHWFLATFLFLYFPRQQLHFLSQHSTDNSFSNHSSHTMDASLWHCHVPTLLLSACSQQSSLWQVLGEFPSSCRAQSTASCDQHCGQHPGALTCHRCSAFQKLLNKAKINAKNP